MPWIGIGCGRRGAALPMRLWSISIDRIAVVMVMICGMRLLGSVRRLYWRARIIGLLWPLPLHMRLSRNLRRLGVG